MDDVILGEVWGDETSGHFQANKISAMKGPQSQGFQSAKKSVPSIRHSSNANPNSLKRVRQEKSKMTTIAVSHVVLPVRILRRRSSISNGGSSSSKNSSRNA